MNYRTLGRTGWKVSDVSFGAWAIGGAWGHVSDEDALAALHRAIDSGVNFIDTADVYGDGRSERLIARLKKDRREEIIVATKAGRRLPRQTVEGRDWKAGNYSKGWENKPVTWVSPDDARAYASWSGKSLPHEWEWQYAAQGTDGRLYPWGND